MRPEDEQRTTAGARDLATERGGGRSWAAIAFVALIVAVGLAFWAMSDRSATTTASNGNAVTTGASPSNPPPVKSPAGHGESNSTR
jgi:hypothetical protein